MIAFSLGNPISSAAWVKAPPLTQATYLAALSHRIQQLIDRIPEEEEPELREMIKSYLEPFNLEPQMESLPFLGIGLVETLADQGFLTIPRPQQKLIPDPEAERILNGDEDKTEPAMDRLELWLSAVIPSTNSLGLVSLDDLNAMLDELLAEEIQARNLQSEPVTAPPAAPAHSNPRRHAALHNEGRLTRRVPLVSKDL